MAETRAWPAAEGTVLHVRKHETRSGRGTNKAYADVTYAAGGAAHTITTYLGSKTALQKGDKVVVHYSPDAPDQAVVDEALSNEVEVPAFEGMVTAILALIAFVFWIALRRARR